MGGGDGGLYRLFGVGWMRVSDALLEGGKRIPTS